MRVIKGKDYKDMSRKAANIISAEIITKPDCVLGLATGSSPIGIYENLVHWYEQDDLDFSQVTSVNLDEYKGLPKENDQSYDYFMHEYLFNKVETHCVDLTESTINANKRFFEKEEDVPRQAYTMGIKSIMKAKKILLIISGKEKAGIVKEAFFGPVTPKVPASILQLHNDVILVADADALSEVEDLL